MQLNTISQGLGAELRRSWFHLCSFVRPSVCLPVCPSVRLPVCSSVCVTDKRMNRSSWKFKDASNKEHPGISWGRLFHAWLDCFRFLNLGARSTHSEYFLVLFILIVVVLQRKCSKSIQPKQSPRHAWRMPEIVYNVTQEIGTLCALRCILLLFG